MNQQKECHHFMYAWSPFFLSPLSLYCTVCTCVMSTIDYHNLKYNTELLLIHYSKWRYKSSSVGWLLHAANTVHSCRFNCHLEIGYSSIWNVFVFVVLKYSCQRCGHAVERLNYVPVHEIGCRERARLPSNDFEKSEREWLVVTATLRVYYSQHNWPKIAQFGRRWLDLNVNASLAKQNLYAGAPHRSLP